MEFIIGMSVEHQNQISLKEYLAYSAGSTVVYYSYKTNEQIKFFIGQAQVNAILISRDGNHLFTGEQSFKNPSINVYLIDSPKQLYPESQLFGHRTGVKQLLESPSQPYLLSLGTEQDRLLVLWNWKEKKKLASNKLSKQVCSIQFNKEGTLLVSVGEAHLKYWVFKRDGQAICDDEMLQPESFTLHEQFALKTYVGCLVLDQLYAITLDGLLCLFSLQTKSILQWIDLNVDRAYGISSDNNYIICACSNSIIRIFNRILNHVITMPEPNIIDINNNQYQQQPNCVAARIHNQFLISVYTNSIMILWDITKIDHPMQLRNIVGQKDGINFLEVFEKQSSKDVTFFAATSSDQKLRICHSNTSVTGIKSDCCNLLALLDLSEEHPQQEQITCLQQTSNGQYLLLGTTLGTLKIMELATFKIINAFQGHSQGITCLALSSKLSFFATGSKDSRINIYDELFVQYAVLEEHNAAIIAIKFVQERFISCSSDNTLLFRKQDGKNYISYAQLKFEKCIQAIEVDKSDLLIISQGQICIIDIATAVSKQTLTIQGFGRISLKIFQQYWLIILTQKKGISLLKYQNKTVQIVQEILSANVNYVEFTFDNSSIILAGQDGCISFWKIDLPQSETTKTFQDIYCQQYSANERKWIISNFWHEDQIQQQIQKCKDNSSEEVGILLFDSESDEEPEKITQQRKDINFIIQTLGVTFAREIEHQFLEAQHNMNQLYHQELLRQSIKDEEDLLHNSFYEEQKSMQEFHRKQNSAILRRQQMKNNNPSSSDSKILISDEQEVKIDFKKSKKIIIPNPSLINSHKLPPKFPQLKIMQNLNGSSLQASHSISNRLKQKLHFQNENSIMLNCSYAKDDSIKGAKELQDSESQYVFDLKAKIVKSIDQYSKNPYQPFEA